MICFEREIQTQAMLVSALVWGAAAAAAVALILFLSQFVWGVGVTFHVLIDRLLPFFLGRELGKYGRRVPKPTGEYRRRDDTARISAFS